ncbi:39578_t:CDS:2, partial [Gigaspora margarita]
MSNDGEIKRQENIRIREKNFILKHLKEEWETAEKNLARRKSLMLGHISAASITILIGICLLLISKYNFVNKISTIVTSSITASGGILALIVAILNKASANKENITKFIEVVKFGEKAENTPDLIDMCEDELKFLKTERHENYIKFLSRINYLIRLEKRYSIWFVILMSLFVIILAIITILVSVSLINIPLPNLSQYLAEAIITRGILWLINIILSHLIGFYETVSNWNWKSACYDGNMTIALIPGSILFAPISIFYMRMKRTYVMDDHARKTYFGEYRTENDDVTFFGAEIDAKRVLRIVLMLNELTDPPINEIQINKSSTQNIIEEIINDLTKEIEKFKAFKANREGAKKLAKTIIEQIDINIDTLVVMLAKGFKVFSKQPRKTSLVEMLTKGFKVFSKQHRNTSLAEIDNDHKDHEITFRKYHIKKNDEKFVITIPRKQINSRKRAKFSIAEKSDKIIKINMKFDEDEDNPTITPKATSALQSEDRENPSVIIDIKEDDNIENGIEDDNNDNDIKKNINIKGKDIEFFEFAMIIAKKITFGDVKDNKYIPKVVNEELNSMGFDVKDIPKVVSEELEELKRMGVAIQDAIG